MKSANSVLSLIATAALAAVLGSTPALTRAATTDLAQSPLGTAASATVLPNLMFILDDSGSMAAQSMPDEVNDGNSCKICDAASGTCLVAGTACDRGHPPFYASKFNTIYYNPDITYKPGVKADGTSFGNATPTAARSDGFDLGSSTTNLTTGWREVAWCDTDTRSGSELTGGSVCKRNGIHTPAGGWTYNTTSNTSPFSGGFPVTTGTVATSFRFPINFNTAPHYYNITPREWCEDPRLQTCSDKLDPKKFPIAAPVRWCKSEADAANPKTVSDSSTQTSPKCQSKASSTYKYPRFGIFTRVNIPAPPSTATYPRAATRSDCTGAIGPTGCTHAQELQNFANWYSYYRTRMLTMKTGTGYAFLPIDDRYRVGFVTINVADDTTRYVKIDKFDATQRSAWYDKLYSTTSLSGTPLREALSRVGRHYAGKTDGINSMMPDDPIQYSCQQNFALLTTDGYWNNNNGVLLDGTTAIGNQDNVVNTVAPFYVTRSSGTFDGNISGSSDALADVAMYYYKTDLRPTMKDNVPTTEKDKAAHQHMVTFTLGLGLDGLMTYRSDYETAGVGDFEKIKKNDPAPACSWTPTKPCDWPEPGSGGPSRLDDLWHAAVNGRGKYFSAKKPDELQSGLAETLAAIQITTGAAASSATSTPNITPTDNFMYSSNYRTVKWDGEVVAEKINASDGTLIPGVVWAAGAQLDLRVSASSDTRTIYTLDPSDPSDKLKPFLYANLNATEKAFFDNKCVALSQCPSLTPPPGQQTQANNGTNLVNWLRGQTGNETAPNALYRDREHVLGDVVNAKPAFVGKPNLLYGDAVTPDYGSFKTANASRQSVLYIPANDGMLHAFNADTGAEMWAYVPRIVMPDLHKLASATYDKSHRYYVDGSPTTMDVFFASQNKWKTVLVGGLNAGGRGYYALDITDPNSPKGLWEVCADPTGTLQCTDKDDNIGLTYGQPIITKDDKDGRWVAIVSSGYNNVSPGDGKGHIFIIDIETGKIEDKQDTGVGDTTTPSGFAKISGFATNFMVNNTTTAVYGGDLLGNVFSFAVKNRKFEIIGQARDATGKMQSITTRPDVTRFDTPAPAFNVVYVGTGRFLGATDIPDPMTLVPPVVNQAYQQSVYGFKDTGANLGNLRAAGANLVQQTLSLIDATSRTISNNAVDWSTKNGWWVDLNPANDSPGERVTIDPQLAKGVLVVEANEPNDDACTSGGNRFFYQFDYRTGAYVASAPGQVVGVKLGAALGAGFVIFRLADSGQLKFIERPVVGPPGGGGLHSGPGSGAGSRASWRELY